MTLIELLIVLAILATLTVYSSTSIQQAVKSKKKIETQVTDMSQIRDALKIIERDVNLAFHYRDIENEMREQIRTQRKKMLTGGTTPAAGGTVGNPPGAAVPGSSSPTTTNPAAAGLDANGCYGIDDPLCIKLENRVDPTTQFVGKENEINFVTQNTSRVREDVPQADFQKVGYSLRSCRKPGEEGKGSQCLLRRSSVIAEGDVTKGGEEIILLQNVSEFKFRYLGKGKQDWVNDWDSIKGDAVTKGHFPEAVEISVTVESGESEKKKKISMQIVAALRFPNNPEEKSENAAAAGGSSQGVPPPGM